MSEATYRSLTITANKGTARMSQEDGRYRYQYNIRVKSDGTGATISFPFTASQHDYETGKRGLGPDDLLWAFACFASDAAAGMGSFEDFCGDFGYDTDSRSAERTWKACKRYVPLWESLWHRPVDPSEVAADLDR